MLHKILEDAQGQIAMQIEEHIRLAIKPCPKYIPSKLWYRLAAKFLILERHT